MTNPNGWFGNNSEVGGRNSEFGIRNSEFGIRNSEFGIRKQLSFLPTSNFQLPTYSYMLGDYQLTELPMTAQRLDGKAISKQIQAETKTKVAEFVAQSGHAPVLAAVLVGDDPASQVYVRNKERACKRVGIESRLIRMSAESSTEDLLAKVVELNQDSDVSGILVQLPLPDQCDSRAILDAINPDKDVDAFHPHNVGLISQG